MSQRIFNLKHGGLKDVEHNNQCVNTNIHEGVFVFQTQRTHRGATTAEDTGVAVLGASAVWGAALHPSGPRGGGRGKTRRRGGPGRPGGKGGRRVPSSPNVSVHSVPRPGCGGVPRVPGGKVGPRETMMLRMVTTPFGVQ